MQRYLSVDGRLSECVFRRQGINSCPYVVLPSLGCSLGKWGSEKILEGLHGLRT